MKENTVILELEIYNEMRDFNKAIKESNTYRVFWKWDEFASTTYTKDQATIKIIEANIELQKEIEELKNPKGKLTINEIKQMSWWEFRKWRRK